jgi:hypothetical protein
MHHDPHPALGTPPVERAELRIARIHRLRGRMDLEHAGTLGQAVFEFRLPVLTLRVQRGTEDEHVGVTGDHAEQVFVRHIDRGIGPIGLARLGVATVLGEQHDPE